MGDARAELNKMLNEDEMRDGCSSCSRTSRIYRTRCPPRRSRKSWVCKTCGTDNGSSSQPAPSRVTVCTRALTGYLAPWGARSRETNHIFVAQCTRVNAALRMTLRGSPFEYFP